MLLFVCSEAVESNLVKLEASCKVILPPMVSFFWHHLFLKVEANVYLNGN